MNDWTGLLILVGVAVIAYRLEKIQEHLRVLVARSEPSDDEL